MSERNPLCQRRGEVRADQFRLTQACVCDTEYVKGVERKPLTTRGHPIAVLSPPGIDSGPAVEDMLGLTESGELWQRGQASR